jgi:hypothetical protein
MLFSVYIMHILSNAYLFAASAEVGRLPRVAAIDAHVHSHYTTTTG